MPNALVRKLQLHALLPADDVKFLLSLSERPRLVPARSHIAREGDAPKGTYAVLDGLVCRYKATVDGRQQNVSYLLPGDFCDIHVRMLRERDHTLRTVIPSHVIDVSERDIEEMATRPALAQALWWATLVNESILREWLINIGSRPAPQRIAHFFAEVFFRYRAIGQAEEPALQLPILQLDLAETVALTSVHTNRTLQLLSRMGLISTKNRRITLLDYEGLKDFGGFSPTYLHIDIGPRA